ncbi:MAG TPA: GGDEF domain-containing protein [Stellaceae bacterium]|nr:GGDEF domain-containing protein [Stellaceae bacterium]
MQVSAAPARRARHSIKARLYAAIGFLGVLPIIGAACALFAIAGSTADNAALDRIARGSIYLERINGLVYAVVMESRGIYMSSDWQTAKPFADNLTKDLSALESAAWAWKSEAIASQQANVNELARRIDQFISFRSELVRLAREDTVPAARAYGDNDANRSVRSALNDSLTAIAAAYETEIGGARAKVEMDDRRFMIALSVLAAIALLALCGGVVLVGRGLLGPLSRVRESMLRLANGDLGGDVDTRRHAVEIGEMEQAIGVFRARLAERNQLNRETRLLSELNEWLQSCNSLSELYDMVAEFLSRLMPGCAGSLYVYANSRDVLEGSTAWNGGALQPSMHPEDCWGLRRGHVYSYGEREIDFRCHHVGGKAENYCCIPVLAHGDTVGLLHLEFRGPAAAENGNVSPEQAEIADQRRLGLICAEQISMAIANVKLRDQLRDQSIRDPLTGLFNRRYMLETCRREFSRAARGKQPVGLLSIDVDHFKKFNDNHGHDAGDTVLREVGVCLEGIFRNEDVVCRFGGEEFVVLMPGASVEIAARRGEELRAKIESLTVRYLEKNLPRITVSIGVAAFPEAGDTPQLLLKAADDALYRAKEGGRNRVELSAVHEQAPPRSNLIELVAD